MNVYAHRFTISMGVDAYVVDLTMYAAWMSAVTCGNRNSELHHTLIPPSPQEVRMPVRYPLRRLLLVLLGLALAVFGTTLPKAAHAAPTLTRVTGFGSNPGALDMYTYRPDGLAAGAPVVVALHGCGQSASDYFGHAGWQKFADQWKFALVFPEQTSANNPLSCFNWYVTGDTARDQGEAL